MMKKLLLILLCLPMIGLGQNVNIPDWNFKAYLVGNSLINTNGDGEIQVSEATVFSGNISYGGGSNTTDLTGIEAFTALTYLSCWSINLTSLDVSQNTALTYLKCNNNQLTNLDVSQNTALTTLYCNENLLTSLDVSGATALTTLQCNQNQLTSLDVSQNTALEYFNCGENGVTSLDVSQNIALIDLLCEANQLTSLDVSGATALTTLYCNENQLTSLDVSQNTALADFSCNVNYIECLDISSNLALTNLNCSNNLLEQLNTRNGNFQNMSIDALSNNLTCVEVDNIGTATNDWDFDSFTTISTNCNYTNPCATVSAIQEHTTNKELLKITDLLGRETKQTNQPLFYIYDDGTVEKRIVIE